jgi:hypothetical protein
VIDPQWQSPEIHLSARRQGDRAGDGDGRAGQVRRKIGAWPRSLGTCGL